MVSGIYICHWPDRDLEYSHCEVLLHRSYHNDVPSVASVISAFSKAYSLQKTHQQTPFTYIQGVSYISLWGENDMLFLAVARRNVDAMSVISLLSQLKSLISHYFQKYNQNTGSAKTTTTDDSYFTRDSVVDNHALVFELLDECVDFGLAQVTDFNILKEYIKMEVNSAKSNGLDSQVSGEVSDSGSDSDSPHSQRHSKSKSLKKDLRTRRKSNITSTHNQAVQTDVVNAAAESYINSSIVRTQVSAISWRPKGIFYPKNDIYIDIIEECEFLYDLEERVVRINHIDGVCVVRSYLSGMPVCKLGLNEKYISQVEYDEDLDAEEEYGESPEPRSGNQLKESDETEDPDDAEESESLRSTESPAPKLMKVPITNVQFHSCVELSKVYKDNLIFFTPPDDEFRLFSYSVEQQRRKRAKPLLMVQPIYRILVAEKKLQIMCTLHTNFRKRLHCNKVIVKIPVSPVLFPLDNSKEDNFRFKCEMGEVRYSVDSSEIFWAIGDLPGSKKSVKFMAEVKLSDCSDLTEERIEAELYGRYSSGHENSENTKRSENHGNGKLSKGDDSTEASATMTELDKYYGVSNVSSSVFSNLQQGAKEIAHQVSISFEMPMFTYSGLKVTYLRVDEDTMKYTCFPWVRYATRASKSGPAKFRFKLGPSNFTMA